ncbi:MAG: hypothetical protein ACM3UW_04650 [Bacillota bacterium]
MKRCRLPYLHQTGTTMLYIPVVTTGISDFSYLGQMPGHNRELHSTVFNYDILTVYPRRILPTR